MALGQATGTDEAAGQAAARGRHRSPVTLAALFAFGGMATIGYSQFQVAGLPLSDYLFAAAAAAVIAGLLAGNERGLAPAGVRRGTNIVTACGLLIVTFGALSSLWSLDPLGSIAVVARYGWLIFGWFWLLRAVTPDRAALCRLVRGLKTAVIVSSIAAVAGYVGLVNLGDANAESRESGFYGHPNHLASLLVVGLPFFLLPMPDARDRPRSLARRLTVLGFVVLALSTTGAITGAFAFVVGLVTAGITYAITRSGGTARRRPLKPLTVVVLVVAVSMALAALVQTDAPVVQRFTRWVEGDSNVQGSVESRSEMNEFVIENFDQRLVLGVGLDKRSALVGVGISIHNVYLKLLHEAGLIALVGLVSLLVVSLRMAWQLTWNTRRTELHGIAVALVSALVSAMVLGLFYPVAFQRQFWVALALTSVLWSLRRHELRMDNDLAPSTR